MLKLLDRKLKIPQRHSSGVVQGSSDVDDLNDRHDFIIETIILYAYI